jgi:hypothetical protein
MLGLRPNLNCGGVVYSAVSPTLFSSSSANIHIKPQKYRDNFSIYYYPLFPLGIIKPELHTQHQTIRFKLFRGETIIKMKQHHVIEIFSANCLLCKHITDDIEIGKCEGCKQVVYDVNHMTEELN